MHPVGILRVVVVLLATAVGSEAQDCTTTVPPRASLGYWPYLEKCGCLGAETIPRASLEYDRWIELCVRRPLRLQEEAEKAKFTRATPPVKAPAAPSAEVAPAPVARSPSPASLEPIASTLRGEPVSMAIPCVPNGDAKPTIALGATWWEIPCVGGAARKLRERPQYRAEAPPLRARPDACPQCWEGVPALAGFVTAGGARWTKYDRSNDSYYEVVQRSDGSIRVDGFSATTQTRWNTIYYPDGRMAGVKGDRSTWNYSPAGCSYTSSDGRTCQGCGNTRSCSN